MAAVYVSVPSTKQHLTGAGISRIRCAPLPALLFKSAPAPLAVLKALVVVLRLSARKPSAVFSLPVVLSASAEPPLAVDEKQLPALTRGSRRRG